LTKTIQKHRFFAVAMNDTPEGYAYPRTGPFELSQADITHYRRTADFLNFKNVDVVSVQHEFGIFGGLAGGHLLTLLRELKAPVVTTCTPFWNIRRRRSGQ
jgi:hypothetical protein